MLTWVFYNNPSVYLMEHRLLLAVHDPRLLSFRYKVDRDDADHMRPGDLGVIRVWNRNGSAPARIVAKVRVLKRPERSDDLDDRFNITTTLPQTAFRTEVTVTHNLVDQPVFIADIRAAGTRDLSILGTNQGCTGYCDNSDFKIVEQLIEQRMQQRMQQRIAAPQPNERRS